jgi:hypothetical protein
MKNLTADQIALNEFIAAENAAFDAKCRAEGATCWGLFALTAVDLEMYGVYNIAQFEKWRQEQDALIDAKEARKAGYCGY